MVLCCLGRYELNVRILLRSLYMTKYFEYFDGLIFIGNLDLPLVTHSSPLDPLQYPVPLDLPEHLLHLVLLDHLHLHLGVDLKHALLRVDAASLDSPDASLGLVLLAVRAQLGVREGLLQVPVVVHCSDLFLSETMQAVLKAGENLI